MYIDEIDDRIVVTNEKNDQFTICYGGADLYWFMDNYNFEDNNGFTITEDDKKFYSLLKKTFRKIEKYDDPKKPTIINNTFTWLSEAEGLLETQNILTIIRRSNAFTIRFYRNPLNFSPKNTCYVCFCLSGSRNQKIANAFSEMFMQYRTKDQEEPSLRMKKNIQ